MSEKRPVTKRTEMFPKGRACLILMALALALALPQTAAAGVVAFDMVGSASQNLTSFVNPWNGAFSSAGDGFQKYQRGVSPTIPFSILDDSLVIFPPDTQGIIKDGNTDVFFGVTDTQNNDNNGPVSATWEFDISGATGLVLSIDMGAMGDFESSDTFTWTYSIDGGPTLTAFENTVDNAGSFTYTMEGGALVPLNDPMLVQGTILSNDLATFSAPLVGTGSTLTLTLTAQTDGGSEAFAFQNLIISEGGLPTAAVAFDMVGSASQNLTSFTNPWNGAFSSAGDGFQKYQRGVSPTIPFSILDDSLVIFPPDTQGIIKDGNTDVFFGVTDTQNNDNNGPVSATWEFDVSAASTGLILSIGMGAMGDFESNDTFQWTYSIDGGPTLTAFENTVDNAGSFTYTMEGGALVTLNDPMLVQGTILSNDLATFSAPLVGTGSTLTLTLTAQTDGGSEAFAFQNLILSEGDVPPPPPSELEIFEIQGSGAFSPVEGDVVTTRDNVVTCLGTNGFFMQTPVARSDNDVDTSDGIFVFTGSAPTVAVGDLVDVTGEVDEFFGLTEFRSGSTITVVGAGLLPPPVSFNAAVPSPDSAFPSCALEFECYEGMRVEVAEGAVAGPNQRFGSDPIAEVFITAAPQRTFREPGILTPGLPDLPVWDGNPEVFELDPDKLGLPNLIIPAGSSFSAVGVLGFEFGGYELWPNELTVLAAPLPAPVRARQPGEVTVGTLNLLRLFDDVDDPETFDAQGNPRDDDVRPTAEYLRRRLKLAAHVLEVLDAPDVLAVQEVESLGVLEALAAEIEAIDPSVVYTAWLEEGNDVGTIDIGFLVRDTVAVDAVTQLGKDETYFNPVDLTIDILHDRPPLVLEGRCLLEFGEVPIRVMTVHQRSLNRIDHPVDGPRVREKRLQQANSVAEKVQEIQDADPDVRLVVIGDFNAYEFTDGYVDVMGRVAGDFDDDDDLVTDPTDLVDPNLANQIVTLDAGERYSFIFRGNAQAIDHALTSQGLEAEVSGTDYGRGNADAAVDLINDGTTLENIPLRSSDHDGLVLYLLKDADADGVPNDADLCPGTAIPESVPTQGLNPNHWALIDGDGVFDTVEPNGVGPQGGFTLGDTAGCSCEQIIDELHLGQGHARHGCSLGVMRKWADEVTP